jgi:YARHG domain
MKIKFVSTLLFALLLSIGCGNNNAVPPAAPEHQEESQKPKTESNVEAAPTEKQEPKHAPRPDASEGTPGIYPEGSTRLLTAADVEGLDLWDLKVMRNEIFARHGYIFKTKEMIQYFNQQDWYNPMFPDVSSKLSNIENKNVAFIKAFENQAG